MERHTDGRTELRWLKSAESSSCFRAWKCKTALCSVHLQMCSTRESV